MSSTAGTETEPSPTPSRTSVTNTLTRLRRHNHKQAPDSPQSATTAAAAATEDDDGSSQHHHHRRRLKDSIEAAVDKIKTRTSTEHDEDRDSDPDLRPKAESRGLHNLLRRSKRKSKRTQDAARRDAERGRSVAKRGTLENEPDASKSSRSLSTRGQSESSLVTYDSEVESAGDPPPLITRPSHAGYLTLSSPLIGGANPSSQPITGLPASTFHAASERAISSSAGQSATDSEPVSDSPRPPSSSAGQPKKSRGAPGFPGPEPAGARSATDRSQMATSEPAAAHDRDDWPLPSPDPTQAFPPMEDTPTNPAAATGARATEGGGAEEGASAIKPRLITPATVQTRHMAAASVPTTPKSDAITSPPTPVTTVTPPTPTEKQGGFASTAPAPAPGWPLTNMKVRTVQTAGGPTSAGHASAHRRVQSASISTNPSRLSRHISPPLTPTIEETRSVASTPGVTSGPSGQGGFFSSVFSAAQNAASSLSNSIANTSLAGGGKGKNAAGAAPPPSAAEESLSKQAKSPDTSASGKQPEPRPGDGADDGDRREQRPLAVETLGQGNLTLGHLGLSDEPQQPEVSSPRVASKRPAPDRERGFDASSTRSPRNRPEDQVASQRAEPSTETRVAVNADAAQNTSGENSATEGSRVPVAEDVTGPRPRSRTGPGSEKAAPDGEAEPGVKRAGSMRSGFERTLRRKRESSSATGTTIATATGTNATVASPVTASMLPRLTGFAVASKKRNRDFHQLFKSVPDDDFLIEDYSAAIQKDILLHGRLYVSERHICFNSNIFGYITTLVISFDEVVSIEKKNTAMVFPNAIVIQTLHARNVFASLASRESTYDLIVGIWRMSHPNLRSSLNGVQLDDAGGGDKTTKAEVSIIEAPPAAVVIAAAAEEEAEEEDDEDDDDEDEDGEDDGEDDEGVYDEDAEDGEGLGSFVDADDGSDTGGSEAAAPLVKTTTRKISAGTAAAAAAAAAASANSANNGTAAAPADSSRVNGEARGDKGAAPSLLLSSSAPLSAASLSSPAAVAAAATAAALQDFPGPAAHKPTECGDKEQHFDRIIRDEVIPAPLGKVYSLLFGPASAAFMAHWLQDEQKVLELKMDDDRAGGGLTDSRRVRTYSYIKPVNATIGPKQAKCIITETLDALDLERAVSVTVLTQTPDVPSGSCFSVRTRYCLTWAEGNATRLFTNCTIDWTAKSWLKVPVEKGANDGQLVYTKELVSAVREAVASKLPASLSSSPAAAAALLGGKARVRRRRKDAAEGAPASGKRAPGGVVGRNGAGAPTASAAGLAALRPRGARHPVNHHHHHHHRRHWGVLEPLREYVAPLLDSARPLATPKVALAGVTLLLAASWMHQQHQQLLLLQRQLSHIVGVDGGGGGSSSSAFWRPELGGGGGGGATGGGGMMPLERMAAYYYDMWRRGEHDAWSWLERQQDADDDSGDDAGTHARRRRLLVLPNPDGKHAAGSSGRRGGSGGGSSSSDGSGGSGGGDGGGGGDVNGGGHERRRRRQPSHDFGDMSEREIVEAIGATQARLDSLKRVVAARRSGLAADDGGREEEEADVAAAESEGEGEG